MDIVKFSNALNVLSKAHPNISSYHFGWGSDINRNVDNNYDAEIDTGTTFPHLQWVAAPEGELTLNNLKDSMKVNLRLYDLQDRDGEALETDKTMVENWRDLKTYAIQLLRELVKYKENNVKRFSIQDNKVEWWLDSDLQMDKLYCLGFEFTVIFTRNCQDITFDFNLALPMEYPVETWDYEDRSNQE